MSHIEQNDPPRTTVEKLMFQVAHGLLYLHMKKVVHGDLHGNNILINDEGNACLTDFGLSSSTYITKGTHTSRPGGAIRWMAPELHQPQIYGFDTLKRTEESDVYGFACVILEVFTRRHPFVDAPTDIAVILKVAQGERPDRPPGVMSDGLWSLVQDCWKQQPSDRLKMDDIIERLKAMDFGMCSCDDSESDQKNLHS